MPSMIGNGLHHLMYSAFAATGAPIGADAATQAMQDFLHLYQTQKSSPDMLYPRVRETLVAFRAADIRIGLCTNKLYAPTLKLLDDIELRSLLDFIAGCDTFPMCKPDPGHVRGVAEAIGAPPESCVMIGDSLNDIRAAQGAGIAAIAITHGYGADMTQSGADATISGFSDLPLTLRKLGFDFLG